MPLEQVYQCLDVFLSNQVLQVKFVDRTFNCNKNYAYLFAFRKVDNDSNENIERCDNDTHIFSIEEYWEEVHNNER